MSQTCLIAAHDPWIIQLLRIYAEEGGFQVVQAFESQDVLPLVHSHHPLVVFLADDLPGQIRGQDVLTQLRSDPLTWRMPVLVFSRQEQDAPLEVAQEATACLSEPITYEAFLGGLKKVGVSCPLRHH